MEKPKKQTNKTTTSNQHNSMKTLIGKKAGLAAILCGGLLASVAMTSSQVGVAISDEQAATISGGCLGYDTYNCNGCSGTYIGFGSVAKDSESPRGNATCCNSTAYSTHGVCTS